MIILVAIVLYLILLVGIGAGQSRKVKSDADFSVAGRSLPPWILVCTMLAVWIGTGSIVGNAGKANESGLATIILPLGSVLGLVVLSFIAPRARGQDVYSVPEIIGNRYGTTARLLGVLTLVTAYMVIVSYQFNAFGAILEVILEDEQGNSLLSAQTGTIIAAVFITLFAMLAGLLSLAFADIVTGVIITLSLLVAFPILWGQADGWSGMEQAFAALGKNDHMKPWGVFSPVEVINFCLPAFLLILGDANQYQRFFSGHSSKGARSAVVIMIFAVGIIESLIILEAWMASSLIPDPEQGRYVLIYAAKEVLPNILGVLFLVTITGIIISTANSFLLIPATTVTRDIYVSFINPQATPKRIVLINRVLVLVFGLIGYLASLAFAKSTTIFEKALYAYTIYGVSITPCLVAAFFWPRATRVGAIASIVTGAVIALAWGEFDAWRGEHLPGWLSELDAVLPAMAVSVTALILGSLLSQNPHAGSDSLDAPPDVRSDDPKMPKV